MQELEKKIKDLKEFIKEKTDQGTANYLGKEIREICGMVESEQFSLHGVSHQRELLLQAYKDGFDSATESLLAANKMVQDRKLQ
jgi:hypothetical protein